MYRKKRPSHKYLQRNKHLKLYILYDLSDNSLLLYIIWITNPCTRHKHRHRISLLHYLIQFYMKYINSKSTNGCCRMNKNGSNGCLKTQLNTFDWLTDIPHFHESGDYVEVQFKNTRKGYYLNTEKIDLYKGDIVAVEASPGHDIGVVTLTGKLVPLAMAKHKYNPEKNEDRKIYRIARPGDIEKWEEAKSREHDTMIQSRQIAADLNLDMKIGDVDYQGDGNKAIFYYIADGRVDFRQLIRVLADTFHVRIEMKQIGARQEAGRIGGIGPCGRQLCCSSWMTNFISVNTSAARIQDLSMNPQKLTGQCAKLKCCMNFEVDAYLEVQKKLPSKEVVLETLHGSYYHFKTDNFQRMLTYSPSKTSTMHMVTIPAKRVFDIIAMNRRGEKPETLEYDSLNDKPQKQTADILNENSLTRFDGGAEHNGQGGKRSRNGRNGDRNRNRKPPHAVMQQPDKSQDSRPNSKNENRRTEEQRRGADRSNRQREGGQNGHPNNQPRKTEQIRNGAFNRENKNGNNQGRNIRENRPATDNEE